MLLNRLSWRFLFSYEICKLWELGSFWNTESFLGLHLVEGLTDVFEARNKGRSHLNKVTSQILPGSIIHVESHVAFPEGEHFSNNVVFEELHAGEHIEHRRLLHPFAQREELSWHNIKFLSSSTFLLANVDDTLRRNGEIFTFERIFGLLVIWVDLD